MSDPVAGTADDPPINFARLEARAAEYGMQFARAVPWPHVVIDDFLGASVAARASATYPAPGKVVMWLARLLGARHYDGRIATIGPALADIYEALQGERFTKLLETITGISPLEPDRELIGGGLHQAARGSYLRLHADHNTHPRDDTRFRRVNVLLYLNDSWQAHWNGDLELWDREAQACRKRISPAYNRCAILGVDDTAYHGYGPLQTPPGGSRRAIAAYYYAPSPAAKQTVEPHSTLWPSIGGQRRVAAFVERLRRALLGRLTRAMPRKNS